MFNYTTSSSRQSFSASCISEEDNNIYGSFYYQVAFSTSLVIAFSSPVTVVGNGLILAAIRKKTFVRTPFHSLLSGLALTDFCTGLIAQPFYSARMFLFLANTEKAICNKPTHYVTIATIADGSATYFITITILLITLMSVERWLHMSRRSSLTSSRKCLTVGTLLLIPFPLVVFRILNDIDGTYVRLSKLTDTANLIASLYGQSKTMSNNTTRECFFTPCNTEDNKTLEIEFYYYEILLSYAIVIAVLSPIAVVGNGLILAAVWKKTFVRTPFHILLSGLAFTDLCTGLIAQPFYAATTFMYVANPRVEHDMPVLYISLNTTGDSSAIYFISLTVLLITLLSIERWLHMSRRSLVTSRFHRLSHFERYSTITVPTLIPGGNLG
ncbi:hypothetical protein ACROYT_G035867 [Oculina patagonica]